MSKGTKVDSTKEIPGIMLTDDQIIIGSDVENLKAGEIEKLAEVLNKTYENHGTPILLKFEFSSVENFEKTLKTIGESKAAKNIGSLLFRGTSSELSDKNLQDLEKFPNLKKVDLSNTKVTPNIAKYLSKDIEEVKLQFCENVKDENSKALEDLPKLKIVDLSYTNVTSKVIKYLSSKDIEELYLQNCKNFNDEHLQDSRKFPNLKTINLFGTDVNGEGFKYLSEDTKELGLGNTKIKDENLRGLKNFHKLEKVDLEYSNVTGEGFKYFSKNLKVIDLTGCKKLNEEALVEFLKNSPNLEVLNLANTNITGKVLKHINKNIKGINLSRCKNIKESELEYLKDSSNTEFLDLSGNYNITGTALKNLPTSLSKLNLFDCKKIKGDDFQFLNYLPSLEYINTDINLTYDDKFKEFKIQNPKLNIMSGYSFLHKTEQDALSKEKIVPTPHILGEQNPKVSKPITEANNVQNQVIDNSTHKPSSFLHGKVGKKIWEPILAEERAKRNTPILGEHINNLEQNNRRHKEPHGLTQQARAIIKNAVHEFGKVFNRNKKSNKKTQEANTNFATSKTQGHSGKDRSR